MLKWQCNDILWMYDEIDWKHCHIDSEVQMEE